MKSETPPKVKVLHILRYKTAPISPQKVVCRDERGLRDARDLSRNIFYGKCVTYLRFTWNWAYLDRFYDVAAHQSSTYVFHCRILTVNWFSTIYLLTMLKISFSEIIHQTWWNHIASFLSIDATELRDIADTLWPRHIIIYYTWKSYFPRGCLELEIDCFRD